MIPTLMYIIRFASYIFIIVNFVVLNKKKNKFGNKFWARFTIVLNTLYSIVCITILTGQCQCGYPLFSIPVEIIGAGLWVLNYVVLYSLMKKEEFSKTHFLIMIEFFVGEIVLIIALKNILPEKYHIIQSANGYIINH